MVPQKYIKTFFTKIVPKYNNTNAKLQNPFFHSERKKNKLKIFEGFSVLNFKADLSFHKIFLLFFKRSEEINGNVIRQNLTELGN